MNLEEWRREIDIIDRSIVRLIDQRARIAKKIGGIKVSSDLPLDDRGREKRIIENVLKENDGGIDRGSLKRIFKLIIRESKKIQMNFMGESNGLRGKDDAATGRHSGHPR